MPGFLTRVQRPRLPPAPTRTAAAVSIWVGDREVWRGASVALDLAELFGAASFGGDFVHEVAPGDMRMIQVTGEVRQVRV